MVKIIVHGCSGKMGKVFCQIAEEDANVEVVAGIDALEIKYPFPVFTEIGKCDMPADVIVDFSTAQAIPALIDYVRAKKMPVVICTTGLSDETKEMVSLASTEIPVFKSANMSLGINLLVNLVQRAAKILDGFDIEIIERHHNQKIDAPSGTALAIADALREVLDGDTSYIYDRTGQRKKREPRELGIHTLRGGTIVGEHEIIFAGKDEIIEFKHSAASKEIFAVGALRAAKFLTGCKSGLYSMEDLLSKWMY